MNLKQTVYFMALVGALAGFACWNIQVWLSDFLTGGQERIWLGVAISATLMGAFIGGMTVAFADHWTSERVVPTWVIAGIVLGAVAGLLTGLVYIPLQNQLVRPAETQAASFVGSVLPWLIAGGLIGLFVGPVVLAVFYDLIMSWMAETRAAPAKEAASPAPAISGLP